MTKHKIKLVFT